MEEGTSAGQEASTRHMQTEKRRRDRIASGFEGLRLLVPCKDRKMDKATFLQEVVDYVSQLQAAVQQAVLRGGLSSLPEEAQWQVRLLLPRQGPESAQPGPESVRAASTQAVASRESLGNLILDRGPSSSSELAPEGGSGLASEQDRRTTCTLDSPDLGSNHTEAHAGQGPSPYRLHPRGSQASAPAGSSYTPSPAAQNHSGRATGLPQSAEAYGAACQEAMATTDAEKRVGQLQHMLRQLLSQQAINAQQLQLQQAAVVQSQVYSRLHLQQQLLQQNPQAGTSSAQQTHPLPEEGSPGPDARAGQDPQALELGRNVQKPYRRNLKVRRHTTAAKMNNPHANPSPNSSSGSGEGKDGRPEYLCTD